MLLWLAFGRVTWLSHLYRRRFFPFLLSIFLPNFHYWAPFLWLFSTTFRILAFLWQFSCQNRPDIAHAWEALSWPLTWNGYLILSGSSCTGLNSKFLRHPLDWLWRDHRARAHSKISELLGFTTGLRSSYRLNFATLRHFVVEHHYYYSASIVLRIIHCFRRCRHRFVRDIETKTASSQIDVAVLTPTSCHYCLVITAYYHSYCYFLNYWLFKYFAQFKLK